MSKTWEMVPLGNVLSERQEKPSEEALASGKIRIVAKIGFDDGKIQLRVDGQTKTGMILIRPGDLVVSGINAAKGAIALYGEENSEPIAATIHYGAYIPQKSKINVKYLWWLLRSHAFRDILQEYVPGGIKTELKAKRLLPVPIPLPQLSEQRRIVAKIEQLAAKSEEANRLRQYSSSESQSVVGNAVRYIFTKQPDKNWHSGCLGDYVVDYCYGTSEKTFDEPVGTPILRMGNIQEGTLDTRDLKYLHIAKKDRDKWILHDKDIIVNRTNSAELVGKCAVFDLEGDWGFASYLIRLRLDLNRADARLVARYINSPIGREYMFRERKQMTGQANVNSKKLNSLPISLPPLDEQHRIVAYLDGLQAQVDRLKALQAQTAAELEALLPSILDQAFKGAL